MTILFDKNGSASNYLILYINAISCEKTGLFPKVTSFRCSLINVSSK